MTTCPICLDRYHRIFNPPLSLVPCGHVACAPCWNEWKRQHRFSLPTCPHCRAEVTNTVPNRDLLDLIDRIPNSDQGPTAPPLQSSNSSGSSSVKQSQSSFNGHEQSTVGQSVRWLCASVPKRRQCEIIPDRCCAAFYVLDNSGSMMHHDGKKFIDRTGDGTLCRSDCTRWGELADKTSQIADYNLRRGMKAAYYLLNPRVPGMWVENQDFVVIDPLHENALITQDHVNTLKRSILSERQIRASTPLHIITDHFMSCLKEFADSEEYQHIPVCYNILTDGQPDDSQRFERSLHTLVMKSHVFLCINLCTEDDNVVEYYNDLDRKLGSELSGMDVIDDLLSEQSEIANVGNNFFVYTNELHTCRMAGCYSIVADLLDEKQLPIHYLALLCKDLVSTPLTDRERTPHWSEEDKFFKYLSDHNQRVYNVYNRRFEMLLNIPKIKMKIQCQKMKSYVTDCLHSFWVGYWQIITTGLILIMGILWVQATS